MISSYVTFLLHLYTDYQDKIKELVQTNIDNTLHLEQMEVDQIRLEEKVASLQFQVSELGRKVLKQTRVRIASAAKVHASRGSLKEVMQRKNELISFPAADGPMLYEEEDNIVDRNSVGQRLKDMCRIS
jgi:hypothetical protein